MYHLIFPFLISHVNFDILFQIPRVGRTEEHKGNLLSLVVLD